MKKTESMTDNPAKARMKDTIEHPVEPAQRDHDGHLRDTNGACQLCGADAREVFGTLCGYPKFMSDTHRRKIGELPDERVIEVAPGEPTHTCSDCYAPIWSTGNGWRHRLSFRCPAREDGGHRPAVPAQVAEPTCLAESQSGYVCTLPENHEGHHLATVNGGHAIARWAAQPVSAPSPEIPDAPLPDKCEEHPWAPFISNGTKGWICYSCWDKQLLEEAESALRAAREERRKPRCFDCNSVGMSHCAHPEECGGVYWPDSMYRGLESALRAAQEEATLIVGQANRLNDELNAEREARKQEAEALRIVNEWINHIGSHTLLEVTTVVHDALSLYRGAPNG